MFQEFIMKFSALFLAATALTSATVAYGSDLPNPKIAPVAAASKAPIYNWTGLYVSAGAGVQSNSTATTNDTTATYWELLDFGNFVQSAPIDTNINSFRALGTIEGGYNLQFDRWVVGVGVSYDFSKSNKTSIIINNGLDQFYEAGTQIKTHDTAAAFAKLGYLAKENTLIYGLAGLATTKVNSEFGVYGNANIPADGFANLWGKSQRVSGLLVGGGFEYMFNQNIGLKTEYRYTSFAKVKSGADYQSEACDCNYFDVNSTSSAKLTTQSLRGEVAYHF